MGDGIFTSSPPFASVPKLDEPATVPTVPEVGNVAIWNCGEGVTVPDPPPPPPLHPTLVICPPVVVQSGLALTPMADKLGVTLNVQAPLTVRALVSNPVAVPAASNADAASNAAVPSAPPATVVRPAAVVTLEANVVPVTPVPGTVAAAIDPVIWLAGRASALNVVSVELDVAVTLAAVPVVF